MKRLLIILGLAAAPTLFAADTNTTFNGLELAPVSLLEQASLVREIAADASRDFDAEAHAKWIQQQMDALKEPAAAAGPAITTSVRAVQPFPSPSTNAPVTLTRPGQVGNVNTLEELQQVIDRLRMLKQGLETRPKPE
jgi:hypothetical protein